MYVCKSVCTLQMYIRMHTVYCGYAYCILWVTGIGALGVKACSLPLWSLVQMNVQHGPVG